MRRAGGYRRNPNPTRQKSAVFIGDTPREASFLGDAVRRQATEIDLFWRRVAFFFREWRI